MIIGGCALLATSMQCEIPSEWKDDLEAELLQGIRRRFPEEGDIAFVNCVFSVGARLREIPEPDKIPPEKRQEHLFLAVAMWVMSVVADGARIEKHKYIVDRVVRMYRMSTIGFWSKPLNALLPPISERHLVAAD